MGLALSFNQSEASVGAFQGLARLVLLKLPTRWCSSFPQRLCRSRGHPQIDANLDVSWTVCAVSFSPPKRSRTRAHPEEGEYSIQGDGSLVFTSSMHLEPLSLAEKGAYQWERQPQRLDFSAAFDFSSAAAEAALFSFLAGGWASGARMASCGPRRTASLEARRRREPPRKLPLQVEITYSWAPPAARPARPRPKRCCARPRTCCGRGTSWRASGRRGRWRSRPPTPTTPEGCRRRGEPTALRPRRRDSSPACRGFHAPPLSRPESPLLASRRVLPHETATTTPPPRRPTKTPHRRVGPLRSASTR